MLRGRSANLLPLLHLVLQIIAGHIHLCSGTGSVLKVSLKYTSQSPEECFGVTVQQQYFPLQVSWDSPGRAQRRSGLHQASIHIPPPRAEETPFIAWSLAWSLLAHTTSLPFCGLWGNWQCFYLTGLWSDITGQLMWFPTRTTGFSGPEACFWIRFLLLEKVTFLSSPRGIIPYISHGHTFCGLEAPYLLLFRTLQGYGDSFLSTSTFCPFFLFVGSVV